MDLRRSDEIRILLVNHLGGLVKNVSISFKRDTPLPSRERRTLRTSLAVNQQVTRGIEDSTKSQLKH